MRRVTCEHGGNAIINLNASMQGKVKSAFLRCLSLKGGLWNRLFLQYQLGLKQ